MNRTQPPVFTASYVQALLDAASEYGVDEESVLEPAGLKKTDLNLSGAVIEQPQLMVMYQAAALLSGNKTIGLEVGKKVDPGIFSTLGYALKSCRTLGEALLLSQEYQPKLMGQGAISVEDKNDHISVHWQPRARNPALMRSFNEASMAAYLCFGRKISGLNISPTEVTFCHARPSDLKPYQALFNCPMRFDTASNSMTVPKFILTTPLKETDSKLNALMLEELKRVGTPEKTHSVSELTQQWIQQRLGSLSTSSKDLAKHLHVSERTLRRLLNKEGKKFQEIKDEVRIDKSKHWLMRSNKPIAQIALLLGYKSPSSFSQAFRAQHGVSAQEFRNRYHKE